jgi:hypothetical protein
MKRLLLIIGFLSSGISFSLTCSCQKNFIPGYLINLNGDTLHGFIDYRNSDVNPNLISFKTTLDKSPVLFHPTSIKSFALPNEIFESAIISVDKASNRTGEISYYAGFDLREDTVFLRTLIQGIKSLYYYFDMFGKEHFFIKKGTEFELLVYKKYKVMKDDAIGIAYNRKYLQQLSEYFQDCPAVLSQLEKTEYNKKNLINLFTFYYDCINSEIEFQKEKDKYSVEYGLLGGPSLTKLNFISISFPYISNVDYPLSLYISGGIFLNIVLPGHQKKYSFNNELFFTSYNVEGRYDEYVNENDYTITYSIIGYSYLKMNNMFRIKYPVRNMFVFANAGMSNGFAVHETNYKKQEVKAYTLYRITKDKAIPDTKIYERGLLLGIGSSYKNMSFEFRYERGNGMSEPVNLQSIASRYYFLLGYKF